LASGRADVFGLHDADISTYRRELPARLLYPLAHPSFGYVFAKGFYYRTDGVTLNGRVGRLLVTPLLRAIRTVAGTSEYLEYLAGFRYPLAGEFAMHRTVLAGLRIPTDWGVEIGVLSEVHRRHRTSGVCQVDVAEAYDHKHQPLSPHDPDQGLHRMAIDIVAALLRNLARDGMVFGPDELRTLRAAYQGAALELVEVYHHDAAVNGLVTNRHLEAETVEVFTRAVVEAGRAYLADPTETDLAPSWSTVIDAVPDIGDRLLEAVEADAR
jgi:glucosyl-3-phosphoglycerate synthase